MREPGIAAPFPGPGNRGCPPHVGEAVARRLDAALEHVEGARDALEAEHVVAVGGDVDLVYDLRGGGAAFEGGV